MRAGPPAAVAHDQARLVGTTLPHPEAALTAGQAEGTVHVDVISAVDLGQAQADTKPHTRVASQGLTVRSAKMAVSSRRLAHVFQIVKARFGLRQFSKSYCNLKRERRKRAFGVRAGPSPPSACRLAHVHMKGRLRSC